MSQLGIDPVRMNHLQADTYSSWSIEEKPRDVQPVQLAIAQDAPSNELLCKPDAIAILTLQNMVHET